MTRRKTSSADQPKAKAKSKATSRSVTPLRNSPKKSGKQAPPARLVVKNAVPSKRTQRTIESALVEIVLRALDDIKAVNVKSLDVRDQTDIADTMIIASGNSDRHVRSIAERVLEFAKKAGFRPMGVEGDRDGEWVLVDLQDVIVHVMLPRVREFYRLESLWDVTEARREAAGR